MARAPSMISLMHTSPRPSLEKRSMRGSRLTTLNRDRKATSFYRCCITFVALALLVPLTFLPGAKHTVVDRSDAHTPVATDDTTQKLDDLYSDYLHGDVNMARDSMLKAVDVLEHANLPPGLRSHGQWMAYLRLYYIALQTKDENEQKLWWQKAVGALKQKLADSPVAEVESWDKRRSLTFIQDWDSRRTRGSRAAFAQPPPVMAEASRSQDPLSPRKPTAITNTNVADSEPV